MTDIVNTIDETYKIYNADEYMKLDIPERRFVMYPFIAEESATMVIAARGTGKTFLGLSMALAIASGESFLKFKIEKACSVLYVDGEMHPKDLQNRLIQIENGFLKHGKKVIRENLRIFPCGKQNGKLMPDLATEKGQIMLEQYIKESEIIFFDNVACLYGRGGIRENESETWGPMNNWSIKQRNQNKSVVWIHHTGKDESRGGRGSSAMDGIIDAQIKLTRPHGYEASDGADILIEYTKTRSLAGEDLATTRARLVSNAQQEPDIKKQYVWWEMGKSPKDELREQVTDMYLKENKTIVQIAKELSVSKTTVGRLVSGLKKKTVKEELPPMLANLMPQ